LFKKTLQEEGHLAKPEDISSFEYALSIHAAAPKIEAHYQFYNTAVEPTLKGRLDLDCETWLHFNGQQYCDADLSSSSGSSVDQEYVLGLSSPICQHADVLQTRIRSSLRSHNGRQAEQDACYPLRRSHVPFFPPVPQDSQSDCQLWKDIIQSEI
jgi:hypothetical protein